MSLRRAHICHVITGLGTGGAERSLYNLLEGGLADAFQTTIVSLSGDGTYGSQLRDLGVDVRSLNLRSAPFSQHSLSAAMGLRRIRPAIVQGWMYHGNFAAYAMQRFMHRSASLFWNIRHSLDDFAAERAGTRRMISVNRALSRRPSKIIYNSHVSRRQHEKFGISEGHGTVIPNGFDTRKFYPDLAARHEFRRRLGIGETAFVFGHVARFHPVKNHVGFIRAASEVAQKNEAAIFLMAGSGVTFENAPLAESIPRSLRNRFHLIGEATAMSDVMRGLDVLVSTSSSEAFPNVLGEAMASGVSCIATDAGDCATIIGETGQVVEIANQQQLVDAMLTVASRPGARYPSLAAVARVQENYQISAVVGSYSTMYENALSRGGRAECAE